MAHDAAAGVPGPGPGPVPGGMPMEAVASPPWQALSRYHTLRGKSMSASQDFDIYQDDNASPGSDGSGDSSPCSRSKSMTNMRRALKRQERVSACEVPPLVWKTKVLCPKPINVAAQSKLKMLEKLKSPAMFAEHAPWKLLAGVGDSESASELASRTDATRGLSDVVQASGRGSGSGSGSPARTMALEPPPRPHRPTQAHTDTPHAHDTHAHAHHDAQQPGRLQSSSLDSSLESSLDSTVHFCSSPHQDAAPNDSQDVRQDDVDVEAPGPEAGDSSSSHESVKEATHEPNQLANQEASHARDDHSASPSSDSEANNASVPAPAPAPPSARCIPSSSQAPSSETRRGGQELLTDEVARLEAETDRILAEQKKLDLARLQTQLVIPLKPKHLILQKLSFFSRTNKRATVVGRGSQPSTPSTIVSATFSPTLSHFSLESNSEQPPTASTSAPNRMSFIEPGGKGIVPQKDAPKSAINGGERRVVVRCLSSTINLPITADTSPVDILAAASAETRQPMTTTTCVVIECYAILGLERRLRRYERIRDVMNSWDRDLQNSLLIMLCDITPNDEHHLALESVPRTEEPPGGFSMQMYHSSRPGKWNKRWVTLLDNGQIYAAKSVNVQPCDKDCSVLCHLTDFDIYTPKESEVRRHLRPPKKFCYAIKSQQKTVVFPNGENFVHFFSTEDAQQATLFYEKVQGWRSWYMVNRMVDLGKKKNKPSQPMLDVGKNNMNTRNGNDNISSPKKNSAVINNGHRADGKVLSRADEAAAETLMDVNEFRISKIVIDETQTQQGTPASPKSPAQGKHNAFANEDESEFFVGGLLGDAYEKRKQAEATASGPSSVKHVDGPFTKAPSLLNGGIKKMAETPQIRVEQVETKTEPKSWFPSAAEHSARIRPVTQHYPHPHPHPHPHQQQRRPMTANDAPAFFSSLNKAVAPSSTTGCVSRRDRHPAPLLNFSKDGSDTPRFQSGFNGAGPRYPPGHPLINFTASAGAVRDGRDARDPAVRRHPSRRNSGGALGLVAAVPPPPPQYPPPPPAAGLQRQQSSLRPGANTQRRPFPTDPRKIQHAPPVPAIPPVSSRRMHQSKAPSRPPPRCPPEPLLNGAR
ncbi:hypothetical protein E4U21_005079 [Claviceps maximensis]|nr:hypothetical protein E4U21_005079 [Claviceps maximensis]